MDSAVPQKYLQEVLDRTLRRATQTVAGIRLHRGGSGPDGDLCTVHTVFERGFRSGLTLCADTALFVRLARQMLYMEGIAPEEVEDFAPEDVGDFAKEYFNVVCGQIAAEIYRSTNISARFQVPGFCRGHYAPEDRRELFAISYTSDRDETVRLTHYTCACGEE